MYINVFESNYAGDDLLSSANSVTEYQFHGDRCKTIASAREKCARLAEEDGSLYGPMFFVVITDKKFDKKNWDYRSLPEGIKDECEFYWDEATETVGCTA